MATKLGSKSVGSIVKLNENGSPVNYIVVHQGLPSSMYDDSCNGTWLLRQDISGNRAWNSANVNTYASSSVNTYLNGTFMNRYDNDIQSAIKQVKIPYCLGHGSTAVNSGADGLSCKVFLLGGYEVGFTKSDDQYFPVDGDRLDYFINGTSSSANNKRIANFNGSAGYWNLRSPITIDGQVRYIENSGNFGNIPPDFSSGVRPALILPTTLYVLDDGVISTNEPPSAPSSINVQTPSKDAQIAITWGAATDSDGTIASYKLERSTNASGWVQIFSGNALTYTDTVGNWGTVAYRVCAVDDDGVSGNYATSQTYTVIDDFFYISGPTPDLGVKSAPFEFAVTTGITGGSESVSGVTCTILLDGYAIHTDYTSTGTETAIMIDTRAISSGSHTITARADKENYVSAAENYVFTTPEIAFPDGGKAEQLQDSNGTPVLPQTAANLVQGLKGESVAGNLEELFSYAKIELLVTAPAGSTVAATNGKVTLPGTIATNGLCSIILPQYGEWTVTATLGDDSVSGSIEVDSVKQYTITLAFFAATITVNTLDGASVTCAKGEVTQTKTATGGTAVFTVTETGEYTVTSMSSGDTVKSVTVTVSSSGDNKTLALYFALADYTWAEIAAISEAGTAADYFQLGDTKNISLSGIGTMTLEIADFDHDYLSGSTSASKAGITFLTKDLLYDEYQMNASDTSVGGFPSSELYETLSTTIWNALPSDLRNVVKTTYKWYCTDSDSGNGEWFDSKIWIPLFYEMFGAEMNAPPTEQSTGNARKYPIFTDDNSRIKKMNNGTGDAYHYWMASLIHEWDGFFSAVDIDGNDAAPDVYAKPEDYNGVCFGVCV